MPCYDPRDRDTRSRDDYLHQRELSEMASLVDYVSDMLDLAHPFPTDHLSWDKLPSLSEMTAWLCGVMRQLSPEAIEGLAYNAHNKRSRALADWWESHRAFDCKRGEP